MWLDKLGEFNEWDKLGKWGEFGNEMIGMNLNAWGESNAYGLLGK